MREQLFTICKEFQGASEISSQEVAYNLLQLPLSQSSRSKVRISTYPPMERVKMLKSRQQLAELPPESDDIFMVNCFDRYAKRENALEGMNLIDFVSGRLSDRKPKVIMYYYYDRKQQFEEFARVQLLLYVPWRKEDELKGSFDSHVEHYLSKSFRYEIKRTSNSIKFNYDS